MRRNKPFAPKGHLIVAEGMTVNVVVHQAVRYDLLRRQLLLLPGPKGSDASDEFISGRRDAAWRWRLRPCFVARGRWVGYAVRSLITRSASGIASMALRRRVAASR